MKDIQVVAVQTEDDIFNSLSSCAPSLYNQSVNSEEALRKLSSKYSKFGACYSVTIGGCMAGFVSCYVNDIQNHIAFLSIIVISKAYQGLGLGTLLLDIVFTVCKQNAMRGLRLEVDKNNSNAIRFYNNRGFVKEKDDATAGTLILFKDL